MEMAPIRLEFWGFILHMDRRTPNYRQPGNHAYNQTFRPLTAQPQSGQGCLATAARLLLIMLSSSIIAMSALLCLGLAGYIALASTLPTAEQLGSVRIAQSTKIYDRNGNLLQEILDPNGGRRTVVSSDQISSWIKKATIATEDPNFYSNPGIDPVGVARAIYYLARYQRVVTGGSTITQQLVKNVLLTPDVTLDRKVREAILSLEVARRYPKDQILAMYLNTVYYGNLSYGVQAAAQSYFHKDAKDLDLGEGALLAGLPQAPSAYDPCENPQAALDRQQTVLSFMVKRGYADQSQADAAATEMRARLLAPQFSKNCKAQPNVVAPHFINYVRQLLEQQYGPDEVYKGGLKVYTTLDPQIQQIAEQEARKQIAQLKDKNVTNAAVVAADPRTGQIYALLGSVNFLDQSIDGQVDVATSPRQPGSSIKPLNYVAALEKGWTLATPILDAKTVFPNGSNPYIPVNYDGRYHGIVNPRIALANSLNIPAVRTLYYVGIPQFIDTARQFGITTFSDPSQYGLSLTLGGGEVKLIDLTGAYSVFANQGERVPLSPFLKIVDGQGQVIQDNTQAAEAGQKIIDPRYAYLISSVLSDNNARTMEFGPNSPLVLDRPVAAKTGTTDDFRDNWTLGYTPELVVGVWVGNSNNTPMVNSTGITGAAPIWHDVMERIYHESPTFSKIAPHDFAVPPGLVQVVVCSESGLLPTPSCPFNHRHSEIFLNNQAPTAPDKYWNGEWGATCLPGVGSGQTVAEGTSAYPVLVDQALARGMPEGLAGLVPCGVGSPAPAFIGGGGNSSPPPGHGRRRKKP